MMDHSPDKNTVVSSANDKISSVVLGEISLIHIKKRSGPRIELCGTQPLTDNLGDI